MKDKFFGLLERVYKNIYRNVVKITYLWLTYKKSRNLSKISSADKKRIKKYWKENLGRTFSTNEYKWYADKGLEITPQLIPNVIWHSEIEPFYSNVTLEKAFQDKNYFDLIIGKNNTPCVIYRCINGQILDGDFNPIFENTNLPDYDKELICKPSLESGGGRGIIFIKAKDIKYATLCSLRDKYLGNFIIQTVESQHEFLSQFNPDSLNTFRVLSFLYKDKVHILSSFLRVGAKGSRLDNVSSGGCFVSVSKDGVMSKYSMRENLNNHDLEKSEEIINGIETEDMKVPFWNKIVNVVIKNHYKLPHFRLINWDIAVNQDGTPIIIEYNLLDSSVSFHQINVGPIFGDLTEVVLKDIFEDKRW